MSKKTFIWVISVLILAILAAWFFFFRSTSTPIKNGTVPSDQSNLFPFGQGAATQDGKQAGGKGTGSSTTTIDLSNQQQAVVPRLRHISLVPTAGVVAFDIGQGSSSVPVIRYMERATGHILETGSASSTAAEISNVTIPKIHEAIWSKDGKNVILRYLKDDGITIRTFSAKISTSSADKALEGAFLADNIADITVFGTKLFYIAQDKNGAQGIRANIDGSAKTAVFASSFGDWTATWTSSDILLSPRPGAIAEGAAYLLNPTTGTQTLAVDRVFGLKALPNSDESYAIYSGAKGNSIGTAVMNLKTAAVTDPGIATLVDKCVWSSKQKTIVYCAVPRQVTAGTYPDDWYKGKTSFTDSLWKIDAAKGTTEDILDPELEAGISMDMMGLSLDQNEKVIVFTDKNDMTVWRLNLE